MPKNYFKYLIFLFLFLKTVLQWIIYKYLIYLKYFLNITFFEYINITNKNKFIFN